MIYDQCIMSSGRHNVIWNLRVPDESAPDCISSLLIRWLMTNALCHSGDIYHHMSSGLLWHLIWMNYCISIMSSGWHTLPLLSHADEMTNFVALQDLAENHYRKPRRNFVPTHSTLADRWNLTDAIFIMSMSYKAEHSWRWNVLIIYLETRMHR